MLLVAGGGVAAYAALEGRQRGESVRVDQPSTTPTSAPTPSDPTPASSTPGSSAVIVAPAVPFGPLDIPDGGISIGATDVVVEREGALWLHPDALNGSIAPLQLITNLPSEGARVSDVEGVVRGTLVYTVESEGAGFDVHAVSSLGAPSSMVAGAVGPIAFDSTGARLAILSTSDDGGSRVDIVEGGGDSFSVSSSLGDGSPEGVVDLSFSVDGQALFWTASEATWVARAGLAEHTITRSPERAGRPVRLLGVDPGGMIVTTRLSDDGLRWGIEVVDATTLEAPPAAEPVWNRQLPEIASEVWDMSADGRTVLWSDRNGVAYAETIDGRRTALQVEPFDAIWLAPEIGDAVETVLLDYLTALADQRYDDAAALLTSGALNDDGRADLRPLFDEFPDIGDEFGNIADLAGALRRWCEGPGLCLQPETIEAIPDSHMYVARFPGARDLPFGYFLVGNYEGRVEIFGLPPYDIEATEQRRVPCPTEGVRRVRFAELDGDGLHETVVATTEELFVCGTNLVVDALPLSLSLSESESLVLSVMDDGEDGIDELLVGSATHSISVRWVALRGGTLVGADGPSYELTPPPSPGSPPTLRTSFGCLEVDGVEQFVEYLYRFEGGDDLSTATAMEADALAGPNRTDTNRVAQLRFELPAELDAAIRVLDPQCGGLPLLTDG